MYIRGKKASLSLSVNAIVVLILAIVLLAFGLSFITKLLGKGEQSLEGLFPSPEVQPTSTKPMAIPDSLLIKSGTQLRLSVPILNTGADQTAELAPEIKDGCPGLGDVVTESITIKSGEVGTVKLLIKGSPTLKDNMICAFTWGPTIRQSYFLTTKGSI